VHGRQQAAAAAAASSSKTRKSLPAAVLRALPKYRTSRAKRGVEGEATPTRAARASRTTHAKHIDKPPAVRQTHANARVCASSCASVAASRRATASRSSSVYRFPY
jgi:hypothetical protein